MRSFAAVCVCFAILVVAQKASAADTRLSFEGFKHPAEIPEAGRIPIKLEPGDYAELLLQCEPSHLEFEWATRARNRKAVGSCVFLAHQHGTLPETGILVELFPGSSDLKADNLEFQRYAGQAARTRIRVAVDANADGRLEPGEEQEFVPEAIDPNAPMDFGIVRLTKSPIIFPMPALRGPDGAPLDLAISIFAHQHRVIQPGASAKPGSLDSFIRPSASIRLSLAGSAEPLGETGVIGLRASAHGGRINLFGLSLATPKSPAPAGSPYYDVWGGRRPLPLEEPFRAGGRWWVLASVAEDLSRLEVAPVPASITIPSSGGEGEVCPSWIRLDVTTREVISPADFLGRPWVLAFADYRNESNRYLKIRAVCKEAASALGPEVPIVVAEDWPQWEQFFETYAGETELPFRLIPANRSLVGSNDSTDLRAKMFVSQTSPATFLMDATGVIAWRSTLSLEESLLELARRIEALKGN